MDKRKTKQAVKLLRSPDQEQGLMQLKQKEISMQHIVTADKTIELAIERIVKTKEME